MVPHLEQVVAAIAFVGARISGLMVFAPFLGNAAVTARVKVGLVVMLTGLLYPVCGIREVSFTMGGMLRIVGSEMLVGLLIGLTMQLAFEAAQFAGQIIGVQVGFGLVNILDPNTQVDTPVLAVFSQTLATLMFLELGLHRWLIHALANSFQYLPPASAIVGGHVVEGLLHAVNVIWLSGIQLAAPVIACTLLVDVSLGFLGKASPQFPVLFLGLPIKNLLGLLLLTFSMRYWPAILEHGFTGCSRIAEQLLHMAH